jgi:hypothetical protein
MIRNARIPGVRLRAAAAAGLCLGALTAPPDLRAQSLREQCAGVQGGVAAYCAGVADAAAIMQARVGIAAAGGNPVPGTASTLGMRLGSTPRVGLALRFTAARASTPPVDRAGNTGGLGFTAASVSLDGSVGVFHGVRLAPTVGGFGSVDLLGSLGVVPLPAGSDFPDSGPFTWAAGVRVGLLRESFTAPGVSVSAAYRSLGALSRGDRDLARTDAHVGLDGLSVTSLRAVVGKRFLGMGLTGGVGHDRYRSDATLRIRDGSVTRELTQDGLAQRRTSAFGSASLTYMILNLSAELGWQAGGDGAGSTKLERGGLFGGVAARLAI